MPCLELALLIGALNLRSTENKELKALQIKVDRGQTKISTTNIVIHLMHDMACLLLFDISMTKLAKRQRIDTRGLCGTLFRDASCSCKLTTHNIHSN